MTTQDNGLTTRVAELARARLTYQAAQERVQQLRAAFEEEHADTLALAAGAGSRVLDLERELRNATVLAYEVSGDKHPAPGCGIREVQELEYDPQEAMEWARSTRMCLQLDRKAFEAIAKHQPTLCHGIRLQVVPKATIATDLAKALEEAGLPLQPVTP